jgi:hypothetical protein
MDDAARSTLGDILQHLSKRHGWHRAQWLLVIQVIWSEIVGDTISRQTRILTLTDAGQLWVAVPSSVWSQEILYYKPRILEAIHTALPVARIRDIRTRVQAAVNPASAEPATPSYSPYFSTPTAPVDVTQDLHELLQHVQEKYQLATIEWLQNGFVPCTRCQAPTLKNYPLCVACEMQTRR